MPPALSRLRVPPARPAAAVSDGSNGQRPLQLLLSRAAHDHFARTIRAEGHHSQLPPAIVPLHSRTPLLISSPLKLGLGQRQIIIKIE